MARSGALNFAADTYVCLDLPASIAEQVLDVRRRHRDDFRAALPAEITVAGSSGVGPVAPGQDAEAVFAELARIASETPPIEVSFGPVIRFPGTDIFVLTVEDERPFRALHERIAGSAMRFQPTPFDYTPHCTLRSRSSVSDAEAAELLALRILGRFIIDTLSVYMLDRLPMSLLYRTKLGGA